MKIDAAEAGAGTLVSGDLEPHPGNDADRLYTLNCEEPVSGEGAKELVERLAQRVVGVAAVVQGPPFNAGSDWRGWPSPAVVAAARPATA